MNGTKAYWVFCFYLLLASHHLVISVVNWPCFLCLKPTFFVPGLQQVSWDAFRLYDVERADMLSVLVDMENGRACINILPNKLNIQNRSEEFYHKSLK